MRKNIGLLCLCLMFVSAWGQYHANQANNHQQQPPNAHLQPDLHKQHNNFFEKQDFDHIKHDLKDQYYVDVDDKTNSKELEYYNFKLHDYDDNGYLDGLELLVALNHDADHVPESTPHAAPSTAQQRDTKHQEETQSKFDKDSLVIDQILNDYDNNQDGLISYYEYMQVRAKYQ